MIKMPWTNQTAPNFMIEVTNACNLKCRACYKKEGTTFKTLEQVQQDLEAGTRLRPVHTITISGGEPTLHPDLCRIVEMIKQRRVHVFLLTNGVLLDRDRFEQLKRSGLDSILFHVDGGQRRPDLPKEPNFADIEKRLTELTRLATDCGIDVSVSATLYGNQPHFLREMASFVFRTPAITLLFISKGIAPEDCTPVNDDGTACQPSDFNADAIRAFFKTHYAIEPFAYIPAQGSDRISWLSYFVPMVYQGEKHTLFRICSNWSDIWLMKIPQLLSGRYIHKTSQNSFLTLFRTGLNALTTFRPISFLRFMMVALSPGSMVRHKMVVYDTGPIQQEDGSVEHCEYCPTAIVRGNQLLPCCVADYGSEKKNTP